MEPGFERNPWLQDEWPTDPLHQAGKYAIGDVIRA